ncbi:methyltransferase domain protein [Diplodia corticola]|uniref:Methyltransferase domain protein n=1 Tax=Diplodia corticola TaxID=236234 RepID=A0A1J9R0U6_9PEZI|nr:methyltransferase domain protein [Diplodia corticola]OJD33866.1 methyltransferase domain protein [Diplodia corticola]
MERIGSLGDGGKWICGTSQYSKVESCPLIVYSFGVGTDSSFEAELINMTNAQVYAFDYSVERIGPQIAEKDSSRVQFMKIGLGDQDALVDGQRFLTLQSIISAFGHQYIDILKMDIEGAEFKALDAFMETYKGKDLPVGQILIEIHLWAAPQNVRDLVKWWKKLEAFGLRPVWQESNSLGVILGPRYPCCFEVSHNP